MSAVDAVIEKVKEMDEAQARALLSFIENQNPAVAPPPHPLGAKAMVGFARRFRGEPRTTANWLEELRAGEK